MRRRMADGVSAARGMALAVLGAAMAAACSRAEAPSAVPSADGSFTTSGGVRYRAETLVLESFPVQLHTIVTATNTGRGRVRLTSGGCEAFLRAYRTPERSGTPAWDQQYAVGCTKILKSYDIAPGRDAQLQTRTGAMDILGDSLPAGRYWFSAVPATDLTISVPAGDAQLDRP